MSVSDSGGDIIGVPGGQIRIDYAKKRLIVSDENNINKLVAGFDENGEINVDLSQNGIDVLSAEDDELIFSSRFNMLKIKHTGELDVAVPDPFTPGSVKTLSFSHGMGKKPAFLCFVSIPAGSGSYIGTNQLTTTPGFVVGTLDPGFAQIAAFAQSRVDNDSLYVDVINPTTVNITGLGTPWKFKFYIFEETSLNS